MTVRLNNVEFPHSVFLGVPTSTTAAASAQPPFRQQQLSSGGFHQVRKSDESEFQIPKADWKKSLKSEHSVWETEQKMVRFPDVQAVGFVQFKKLDYYI